MDPFEIRPESGLSGRWPIRWRPGTSVEGGTRFWPSGFRFWPLSYNNIVLNIIPTLYEGYIVSVHRMVVENHPVHPGSIQGSHRSICFIRIKHRTRANDFCETEYY